MACQAKFMTNLRTFFFILAFELSSSPFYIPSKYFAVSPGFSPFIHSIVLHTYIAGDRYNIMLCITIHTVKGSKSCP